MKVRNGFVSNSSSSSFLISLPKDFDKEALFSEENIARVKKKVVEEWSWMADRFESKEAIDRAKESLDILLENGWAATSDPWGGEDHVIDDEVLNELLKDYEVASLDGAADSPSWMILVDTSKSTGKELKRTVIKDDEDEDEDEDEVLNAVLNPNETNMSVNDIRVACGTKFLDPDNPPKDKKAIRRANS